ncbi:MAG TPA: hypothetical protein VMF67_06740 [Rhizomicrobium sp.]|nr:hypothetical protein [Rhizomicrobium sp.]
MKRWIGPALALALAGCDTIGGIKYDFESGSFGDKTKAVAQACMARMQDHALDPIRTKVEFYKSPPDGPVPFAILTDNAMPTPEEQQAIELWARAIENCQADTHPAIDEIPVPPGATQSEVDKLTSYFTDAWVEGSKLRVALYSGRISYADYASQRLTIAEDALKAAERYAQDTDEENETHDLEGVESALEPYMSLL